MSAPPSPRTPARRGLGRGLGALIPTAPPPAEDAADERGAPQEEDRSVGAQLDGASGRARTASPDWIGRIPDPPQAYRVDRARDALASAPTAGDDVEVAATGSDVEVPDPTVPQAAAPEGVPSKATPPQAESGQSALSEAELRESALPGDELRESALSGSPEAGAEAPAFAEAVLAAPPLAERAVTGRPLGEQPLGEQPLGEQPLSRQTSGEAAGPAPDQVAHADAVLAASGRTEEAAARDAAEGASASAAPPSRSSDVPADMDQLRPVDGAYFAELPVNRITPNPRQPRQIFDEESMAELVDSIREVGLLQPVVVRPVGDRYELVMGERRWRATQEAGLALIPAIVRDTGDDELLRDALLENLHRAQLNPLEEAAAYQQLLDDFGCTHEELATRIGRSRPQISNTLRLLKLSPPVQRRVAAGVLSAGHARTLLGLEEPAAQDRLAERVVAEGISVRGLEELVALGGSAAPKGPRARRAKATAPAVEDLAERLSDLYDTRVKIDLGRSKGRITIEFASLADLERIVSAMDPTYERRHVEE